MRKEWITESKHGLSYNVSDEGGEMTLPVTWKGMDDFMADLEQASQAAFATDLQTAAKLKGKESATKFQAAWTAVLIKKMRRVSDA
jgi:hypothetical protein